MCVDVCVWMWKTETHLATYVKSKWILVLEWAFKKKIVNPLHVIMDHQKHYKEVLGQLDKL